jgi:4-hydroxybenzoate polyprenyltransferase
MSNLLIIIGVARSLRPLQWLKNASVFTALFLGGQLFDVDKLSAAWWTFVTFCLAASSMYLLNDLTDRQADKLHPTKRHRPIAAGLVPAWLAVAMSVGLAAVALGLANSVHKTLVVMVVGYMALQLAYTFLFKRAIIIDAMLIALGFVLRVYAGAFVIAEPLSAWLLLSVASGAWFLALGKRRSELTLMGHRVASEHRQTLSHYPEVLLDSLTTMAATSTLVFYSLYTFLSAKQVLGSLAQFLPATLEAPKLLMLTLPLVLYGIARYLYLIYEKKEADSPELALLHDWPLLLTAVLLVATMAVIIYVLPQGVNFG